jgi:hypothetical protein
MVSPPFVHPYSTFTKDGEGVEKPWSYAGEGVDIPWDLSGLCRDILPGILKLKENDDIDVAEELF